MKKTKIYIAGKVTGEDKLKCAAKFQKAQLEIEALDLEAVNPLTVVGTWEIEWQPAMRKCIKALMDCDAILVLPDAYKSKGAVTEMQLAHRMRIRTFFKIQDIAEWNSLQPIT